MPETPNFEAFKTSIARIYGSNGTVVGAGFLASGGCLLTCAHVVTVALAIPQNTADKPDTWVEVDFPLSPANPKCKARVVWWNPVCRDKRGEDIAILEPQETWPASIQPITLAPDQGEWESTIRMFGFPKDFDNGIWVTGKLRDRDAAGLVQMDAIAAAGDRSVEKGFSGAPVWHEATQTVVGMAVAAEKRREAVTAAYFIPSQTLLKYALEPLQRQRLLDLLTPYSTEVMTAFKAGYRQLCPPDWRPAQAMPTTLESLMADLADMPDQEGYSPLDWLVADLYCNPPVTVLKPSLLEWLKERNNSTPELLGLVMQSPLSRHEAISSSGNPYLLVLVKPSTQKEREYYVDGWFLANGCRDDAAPPANPKPLTLPETVNEKTVQDSNEATFTVDEVPIIIAEFLNQIGEEGINLENLTIEVFVPLQLLNDAIDGWPIIGQYGCLTNPLCQQCCHVFLRSYERLKRYRSKGLWQDKWNYFQAVQEEPANDHFIAVNPEELQTLGRSLQRPQAIAAKLSQAPPSAARGGSLALILETATPIALWLREALTCAPDVENLLDCALHTVADRVTERRREAYDNDDDSDLGKHLSLIWENPYRIPPDINYTL